MVFYILFIFVNSCIYFWLGIGYFGYHGIFMVFALLLWLLIYNGIWGIYNSFLFDLNFHIDIYRWVELGNILVINMEFEYGLFGLLLSTIMGIGLFMVLLFIYFEMWDDKEGVIFILLLVLFVVFMAILVFSGNIIVFYVGWEGIGLVSLFLIGFWSERIRSLKAVFKVFTINKMGDLLILVGIITLVSLLGCINFNSLSLLLVYMDYEFYQLNFIGFIVIIFIFGGGVKSSQYGVHIWLLEAMEAPLGASALMHSSTLVVAGILLVYKIYAWVYMSILGSYLLVIWGSWTALFAAIVACYQFELKVILAYSTISSMGFLYLLLGLGTLEDLLIYLLIHAFIKIYLFLIVGLLMYISGGTQDLRWMGGLFSTIPYLFFFYFSGALALGGLPYWAGYYCKSALWIYTDNSVGFYCCLRIFLVLSTFYTYLYLGRLGWLIFGGSRSGPRLVYRFWNIGFSIQIVFLLIWAISLYLLIWWLTWVSSLVYGSNFIIYFLFSIRHSLNLIMGFESWLVLGLAYSYILYNFIFYYLYWNSAGWIGIYYYGYFFNGGLFLFWLWIICEFI